MDQLTTLSLKGDATVQEYMANLKVGLAQGSALGAAESDLAIACLLACLVQVSTHYECMPNILH